MRRSFGVTVFLVLLAGLTAGVVAATFQAASRAGSVVDRYLEQRRTYDVNVQGCPPGRSFAQITTAVDAVRLCLNLKTTSELRSIVDGLDPVESTAVGSFVPIGILDAKAANGWGVVVTAVLNQTPESADPHAGLTVINGRRPDPRAIDEVALTEAQSETLGVTVGDTLRLAGWDIKSLDFLGDGSRPPTTPASVNTVVGIVRDEVPDPSGGGQIPEGLIVTAAWSAAHPDFAALGSGVAVRLLDEKSADAMSAEELRVLIEAVAPGWSIIAYDTVSERAADPLHQRVDSDRTAMIVFGAIAALTGIGLVGLAMLRQFRREMVDRSTLIAIGSSTRDIASALVVRSLTVSIPAVVVSLFATVALSSVSSVGVARRLETQRMAWLDSSVLFTIVVLLGLCVVVALLASRPPSAPGRAFRPHRMSELFGPLGVSAQIGASFARGRAHRTAAAVAALVVGVVAAASMAVESLDRTVDEPARYGAWWDASIAAGGDSAAQAALMSKLDADPAIDAAASYYVDETVTINGQPAVALVEFQRVGRPPLTMLSGRPPAGPGEIAVGPDTINGVVIGDTVSLGGQATATSVDLEVVGIALVAGPGANSASGRREFYVFRSDLADVMSEFRPDVIAIRLSGGANRGKALESIAARFDGATLAPAVPIRVTNLIAIRQLPTLLAGLVGALSITVLVQVLITQARRQRRDLDVLAVLGLVPRQTYRTSRIAAAQAVGPGAIIGVPFGLVLGSRVWRAVAERNGLLPDAVLPWTAVVVAPIGILAISLLVATVAARIGKPHLIAQSLRVE